MNANEIVNTAVQLGYYSCGIINVADVSDYADRLDERIARTPENSKKYSDLYKFAHIQNDYPWAKSIVICVRQYGKYRIPKHMEGMIAKYYLTDSRKDKSSPDYQASIAFENYWM